MELIFEFLNLMVNIYLLLPFFKVNYLKILTKFNSNFGSNKINTRDFLNIT